MFVWLEVGAARRTTVLKVRDDPDSADAPAWFEHPTGTVAARAEPSAMSADGIDSDG